MWNVFAQISSMTGDEGTGVRVNDTRQSANYSLPCLKMGDLQEPPYSVSVGLPNPHKK